MEAEILSKILESGAIVIILLLVLYHQRKDGIERDNKYNELINKVMSDNGDRESKYEERERQSAVREANYQKTIGELVEKFNLIEEVKETIESVQEDLNNLKDNK